MANSMVFGEFKHGNKSATLNTNDARPLAQAVVALRQEYGWLLDYEDPIYAQKDLVPVMAPEWLAAHPQAKKLLRPAGGAFSTTYNEDLNSGMNADQDRASVLQRVLADYGQSGNPGHFEVVQTAPWRLDVIGRNDSQPSVLDTKVTISMDGVAAYIGVENLLKLVQVQVGHRVGAGIVPIGALMRCTVNHAFTDESARSVLIETLDLCHLRLVWQLLYDANLDTYLLNLDGAAIVARDVRGNRILGPAPLPGR